MTASAELLFCFKEQYLRQWRVQYWVYCIENTKTTWNVFRYYVYCLRCKKKQCGELLKKRCVLYCGKIIPVSPIAKHSKGQIHIHIFKPFWTHIPKSRAAVQGMNTMESDNLIFYIFDIYSTENRAKILFLIKKCLVRSASSNWTSMRCFLDYHVHVYT